MSTTTLPRPNATAPNDKSTRFAGLMSVAEYHEFELRDTSGQRYEYEDGKVFRVADTGITHGRIAMNLLGSIYGLVEAVDDTYHVLGCGMGINPRPGKYVYADLVIVCDEPRVDNINGLQNPFALFEVLRPDTEADDRGAKFAEYKRIDTLRHYVLVEQDAVSVSHYEKNADTGEWGEPIVITELADTLTLRFADGVSVAVPLSRVYKRVFSTAPTSNSG